jgi:site-specific DNA recombinase
VRCLQTVARRTCAPIYARRSQEQERAESVERQLAHARRFAEERGWIVDHVFSDNGLSGADFDRPGLTRLLGTLTPHPPFRILVVMDLDRIGREQYERAYLLKRFAQAGIAIYEYLTRAPVRLETPTDKFLMSASGFAAEVERDKARQRTHDALLMKARAGHVTGGRVFGYTNRDVETTAADGRRRRLYVERVVHVEEAAVVRRIFALCAEGLGFKSIAVRLNDEGALAPLPRRAGRPRGWAPSSVREVLHRELYRGVALWNRTAKRDAWGHKHERERAEAEWVRLEVPELQIVSAELWEAAHARLARMRQAYVRGTGGPLWGRPPAQADSKYLLTGLAVCGWCGGWSGSARQRPSPPAYRRRASQRWFPRCEPGSSSGETCYAHISPAPDGSCTSSFLSGRYSRPKRTREGASWSSRPHVRWAVFSTG